jgi:hypothetical protein
MRNTSVPAPLFHGTSPLQPVTSGPTAEIVTVTPAMAKEWLKQNTNNRNLRKNDVFNYARDMASGRWLMNGEAIKFCTDGRLLDGQHRLHAVLQAGIPVPMLVITGLPAETQHTMDAGIKRTTADAFSLDGQKNATVLAAVLRRVWLWDQGDHKFSGNYKPTTAECAELLSLRPEIHRSVEIAVHVNNQFKYIPQSATGTAHHLFSRINPGETAWFFTRLADGAELSAGHPILALRNRAMSDRADRRTVPDWRHLAHLIRAWNAVRTGRTLARILQAPDAAMPMPK